jgi:3-hydroxyisobutyrate dehydrogenase
MLIASEGLGAIAKSGVDVEKALEAINGSSGRSWVTMQRFPDNILTGKPYGFALGMHCKDMENAMDLASSTAIRLFVWSFLPLLLSGRPPLPVANSHPLRF